MFLMDKFFDGAFFTFGLEVIAFAERDQVRKIKSRISWSVFFVLKISWTVSFVLQTWLGVISGSLTGFLLKIAAVQFFVNESS